MLLADQDEDCQFRNPGGLQVFGLHAEIQLFPQGRAQPRVDELPKLQFPGHLAWAPRHVRQAVPDQLKRTVSGGS